MCQMEWNCTVLGSENSYLHTVQLVSSIIKKNIHRTCSKYKQYLLYNMANHASTTIILTRVVPSTKVLRLIQTFSLLVHITFWAWLWRCSGRIIGSPVCSPGDVLCTACLWSWFPHTILMAGGYTICICVLRRLIICLSSTIPRDLQNL